jgi:spore germination cell wall hydrolase CwlJ-like protein
MVELELATTCLALVLFGEAGGNFDNQMAVYNVVMNRAKTISRVCNVVYEPKQFEYISLIQQGRAKEPTQIQLLTYKLQAVKFLTKQKGYTHNPVGHSKFFHDSRIHPKENVFKKPLLAQVNNLYFY